MKIQTIKIKRYLSEKKKKLLSFLDNKGRILLVANPGTGKTFFSAELAKKQKNAKNKFIYATFLTAIPKQLNTDFNFDLVCSSYENKWTSRIENLQPGDDLLEKDEHIIGTTLHQLVRFAKDLTKNDVIVIDESHQLVQLAHQTRILQLREELLKTKAKLLLMSGTPYLTEKKRLNLSVVEVVEEKPRQDNLIYLPLTKELREKTNMEDLSAALIHWHLSKDDNASKKKMLVYNNNSKIANKALIETVKELTGYVFDEINADTKDSEGYKHLMANQEIRPEAQGIVTTSAIKEGVNIKNQNIEKVIVLGNMPLKDEKQIAKRIRGTNPIEIFRIYNEPDQDTIDEVDFEIDLVNLLSQAYKTRPERLKKILQRLAKCGELLTQTGILNDDVESINEVKTEHIMEYLDAAKCTLKENIDRQVYNDLKAVDGIQYLKDTYGIFLATSAGLGQFSDKIKYEKQKAREEREEELISILITLFGNSKYFDTAISALKGDLISYSAEGKILQELDTKTIKSISSEKYINPAILSDAYDNLVDADINKMMIDAVQLFSLKFRDEMTATLKILRFLINHAKSYKDVLLVFNEKIDPLKLEWTADRFVLSERLEAIRNKGKKVNRKKGGLLLTAVLPEKDDRVRLKVMQKVDQYLKDYSVFTLNMLTDYISNNHGSEQYLRSLNLHKKAEIKLFVYAMGIASENSSWKRSENNKDKFDKLWTALGNSGIPKNRDGLRVIELEPCGPSELIENL